MDIDIDMDEDDFGDFGGKEQAKILNVVAINLCIFHFFSFNKTPIRGLPLYLHFYYTQNFSKFEIVFHIFLSVYRHYPL